MKEFRKWVNDACWKVQSYLNLQHWRVTVAFVASGKKNEDGNSVVAQIDTDFRYLVARITFYPDAYKFYQEEDFKALWETIFHEYCHILTDRLYELACNDTSKSASNSLEIIRESSTEHICRCIMKGVPKSFFRVEE